MPQDPNCLTDLAQHAIEAERGGGKDYRESSICLAALACVSDLAVIDAMSLPPFALRVPADGDLDLLADFSGTPLPDLIEGFMAKTFTTSTPRDGPRVHSLPGSQPRSISVSALSPLPPLGEAVVL